MKKLVVLLREPFQLDQADLDYGGEVLMAQRTSESANQRRGKTANQQKSKRAKERISESANHLTKSASDLRAPGIGDGTTETLKTLKR